MALFGKKEQPQEAQVPPAPQGLPVDQVTSMREQGYTNNQIIQALQKDGYTSQQVFDAMKQSDLNASQGGPVAEEQPSQGMPPPPEPQQPDDIPPPAAPISNAQQNIDSERIEQIAESIIEEKLDEVYKDIERMSDWKDTVEKRLADLESNSAKLKEDFDKLHSSLLGKIGEYDQNILNVGTEIKAMEKVFQKILPTLTDNVKQLSEITKSTKKK